jgi:mannan endo-1,4-beta-mannosidase
MRSVRILWSTAMGVALCLVAATATPVIAHATSTSAAPASTSVVKPATTASGAVKVLHPNRVVHDGATPASVLSYLRSIEGNHTISGQHNAEPNSEPAQYTNEVDAITGVYPGLWGGDFLYG